MYVDLRTLQPNPMRDFTIDPIDLEAVAQLKRSIAEDGFWGGIVCRQLPDGTIQSGAGHHRVKAALAEGITTADLFVGEDMDDAAMVRVYVRENATQRGMSSTALTGSVAAAMKFIAKAILTGVGQKFLINFDLPTLRRRLLSDDGMGERVLLAFLHGIPGINVGSIQQQLANLKTSGDYARLIADVEADIARDHPEALEAIAARVIDLDDPLGAEFDENEERKQFTPSEKIYISEAIDAQEQQLAEQRKHEGQKSGGRGKKKLGDNLAPSLEEGKSRDLTAAKVGWSGMTYEKAKAVVHAADKDPNFVYLVEEMDQAGKRPKTGITLVFVGGFGAVVSAAVDIQPRLGAR